MINYEKNSSPFFIANKNFCEKIEAQLQSFMYDYSGFCNAYGYEINTNFKTNNLICTLKYVKHQTTRNGVIIPVDATDYAGINLSIEGFDKKNEIDFGKSKIKRFFSTKKLKSIAPTPFYITTNSSAKELSNTQLFKILLDNKVDLFKLKNGTVKIKIHSASTDIFELIHEIEKILLNK